MDLNILKMENKSEIRKPLTPEQIQKSISASFDSVDLINKKITETKTEEKVKNVDRNVKHLNHMLTKEWFLGALSQQQKSDIDASIVAGTAYCS